ncbi:hydroxyethylthiazole kinase [Rhizobium sp. YIM 134829]|uniref:hydroxyethylthiazole kinase n=1 Tax=Rhizobium sp. YIM 134829 TaxID=3390453 RepID=UPI003979B002
MTQDHFTGQLLHEVRQARPLVHCITNYVAMSIAANVLLAAGASPAMVHAEQETEEFAALAGALTINIGTLSAPWVDGMRRAIRGATTAGRPWVLDPVAHQATRYRSEVTASLMALSPTIIRGNASEILALSGAASRGQGADSGDPVAVAEYAARRIAHSSGAVVAVTGSVDFVTDGRRARRIHGGSELMPQVTALGCALTCLIGAYAAARPDDPFEATTGALALFAVAGSQAGAQADGAGSFAWRFLDRLTTVDPAAVTAEARIETV